MKQTTCVFLYESNDEDKIPNGKIYSIVFFITTVIRSRELDVQFRY